MSLTSDLMIECTVIHAKRIIDDIKLLHSLANYGISEPELV